MDFLVRLFGSAMRRYALYQDRQTRERLKSCGRNASISPKAVIWPESCLEIGDNVHVGAFTAILAGGGVSIGSDTMVSSNCSIMSVTHAVDSRARAGEIHKPVRIGRNVWIGAGAVILPGVTIGDHSVIGAGSVVTRSVPPMQVYAGNPARFMREVRLEEERPVSACPDDACC
jgi:maltose O-acetyltransferase